VDAAGGSSPGTTSYTYDNRDRLLTENGTVYSWSANGNLVGRNGDATYEWDFEDRLVKVTKSDGTVVENVYDVDGVLVRTAVNGVGTDYLVDTSGGLSHVVAEVDSAGAVAVLYVRAGDMLLEEVRGGVGKMYEADGLGSVRGLLDATGATTDTWSYTAFGETLSTSGSDLNPYRFAGERLVDSVGMYQNRARWLLPSIGAFISEDPLCAFPNCRPTLRKYAYAYGNPATIADPTGLDGTIGETMMAGVGYATLNATAIASFTGTVAIAATAACALSVATSYILQETNVIEQSNGGPCQGRSMNRMRVQLQQSRSGTTFHTAGIPLAADQSVGVTVRAVQAALGVLFISATETLEWFPLSKRAELGGAVVVVSRNLNSYPPGGTATIGTIEHEEFGEFRVEVENLRGRNLRRLY
jgi:RHS repeat-associated protein